MAKGTKWPGPHPAPQLVMAPAGTRLRNQDVDNLVAEFIEGHRFHGFHFPMEGKRESAALLEVCRLADANDFWVHVWVYGDRQHGQAPPDPSSDAAKAHQRAVARALGAFANVSFGMGFDLHEWADSTEVRRFTERVEEQAPGHRRGGRALFMDDNQDMLPNAQPLPGTYAGWEQRVVDKRRLREYLNQAIGLSGRPHLTEDRFRVRPGDRGKDWTLEECLVGMEECLRRRVAAIWGYRQSGDPSDLGSEPWPNKDEVAKVLAGLEPPPVPPPDGDECRPAADYAVDLRALETRFRLEVTEPLQADVAANPWKAALLGAMGFDDYLPIVEDIGAGLGTVMEEMETCTPPSGGGNGNGNGGNGNGGNGDPPPSDWDSVVVASNSAQDVADWEETARITRVRIQPGRICLDYTKRGKWPVVTDHPSAGHGDPLEGNPWVFAEIDGKVHGGCYEWNRPGQECKAMGTDPPEVTVADVLGPHIKQGPLRDWVPKPGERVGFAATTICRNGERSPVNERSNIEWVTWPDWQLGGTDWEARLRGAKSIGVERQWKPNRYGTVHNLLGGVTISARNISLAWPNPEAQFPEGDFGPFKPGEVHFGRVYILAKVDGEWCTWGIEWLRFSTERTGTSIGLWEDHTAIFQTLAAKAKDGIDHWRPKPGEEVAFYFASPLVKARTNLVVRVAA